ncbi:MAG TPA: response regulator [Elusimicrobiota bacterium]|nr:response regulator [Elusimicrobiota bacterium]
MDKKKIVTADDDPETLEFIKMALEMAGYDVKTASDGRQALEVIKAEIPDVCILDVMMPYVDGYHVAEEISEKLPQIKILLLTSRDFGKDKLAIEASGADAYMSKPFDVNEFLRVIKDLLT